MTTTILPTLEHQLEISFEGDPRRENAPDFLDISYPKKRTVKQLIEESYALSDELVNEVDQIDDEPEFQTVLFGVAKLIGDQLDMDARLMLAEALLEN